MRELALLAGIAVLLGGARARADTDYFGQDAPPGDEQIAFRVERSRTTKQRVLIASLLGGAAVAGGIGLYYHLDSRDKSGEVEAVGEHSGRIYTPAVDAVRRGALDSRDRAIVGYAAGGLLLAGAVVALYVTDPGSETVTLSDDRTPPDPVVPVSILALPGGAGVAAGWRF